MYPNCKYHKTDKQAICLKRKRKGSEYCENNVKKLSSSKNENMSEKDIPVKYPRKELLAGKQLVLKAVTELLTADEVFFDVETTSLKWNSDIIQIAAVSKNDIFDEYIIPSQLIVPKVSDITGITFYDGVFAIHGHPLEAKARKVAVHNFLKWVESKSPVRLFAHNAKFDYTRFFHAIDKEDLVKQFQKHIIGFVDTLEVFKTEYPGLVSYKQDRLVEKFLKKFYDCHNAVEDSKLLQELYNTTRPHGNAKFCTFTSAYDKWICDSACKMKTETFRSMIRKKYVSGSMAKKMAYSGLTLEDLHCVYEKDGNDGLVALLSGDEAMGKPCITKHKRIINSIISYLHKFKSKYVIV